MQPELVLNEDDKKRRFKKFLRKKEDESISNAMNSPELQHSHDDSPYERLCEMPPLQPIESIAKTSIPFSRGTPFPLLFPCSTKAISQNEYNSKLMNSCQDWKRFDSHKTKNNISPDKDFLSELRSEVRNYVKVNQYEHKISRKTFSSISPNYLPDTQAFSLPSSLSVTVKPVPKPYMPTPSPPASPEEHLPLVYSHAMKDFEAWRYFANKGLLPRNSFPAASMSSPDNLRKFFVGPDSTELFVKPGGPSTPKRQIQRHLEEYAHPAQKHIAKDVDQRPSVITQPNHYNTRCISPTKEELSFKIKLEKLDDYSDTKN